MTSLGIRSGVNWMRLNSSRAQRRRRVDQQRLGEAGHAFEQAWPSASSAISIASMTPSWPTMVLLDLAQDASTQRVQGLRSLLTHFSSVSSASFSVTISLSGVPEGDGEAQIGVDLPGAPEQGLAALERPFGVEAMRWAHTATAGIPICSSQCGIGFGLHSQAR